MYKKLFFLIFIPVFFLFGCASLKDEELESTNEELVFKLDKVQLTKSFQKIESFAQFKNKSPQTNNRLEILVSAGLMESSGIVVDKVVKNNQDLDIYLTNIEDENSSIVVPQALISLDENDIENPEKMKLNIVGENLKPINLKILYSDATSLVESHFKLFTIAAPQVSLLKNQDSYYWQLDYDTVFDKSSPDYPIVSFSASVDATSGEILNSKYKLVAHSLAQGNIVGYFKNRYLVYKTLSQAQEDHKEELWVYDDRTEEKILLFSSNFQTSNLHFSPNGKFLSFIELGDKLSNLYLVPDNKKAYRISLEEDINPVAHSWIDNKNICLVETRENRSYLYKLNIETNKLEKIAKLNNSLANLSSLDETYLFSDNDPGKTNNNIYITNDFNDFSLIGAGYNPKFLNQDILVYMEAKEKEEAQTINFYSIEEGEVIKSISGLMDSYQILDTSNIFYAERSKQHNNYLLNKYNLADDLLTSLGRSNSSKLFYNRRNKSYFVNFNSPLENDENMLIYNIKNKLK